MRESERKRVEKEREEKLIVEMGRRSSRIL